MIEKLWSPVYGLVQQNNMWSGHRITEQSMVSLDLLMNSKLYELACLLLMQAQNSALITGFTLRYEANCLIKRTFQAHCWTSKLKLLVKLHFRHQNPIRWMHLIFPISETRKRIFPVSLLSVRCKAIATLLIWNSTADSHISIVLKVFRSEGGLYPAVD